MAALLGNPLLLTSAPSGDDAYVIKKSLKFEDGDTPVLTRKLSAGNRRAGTIAFWLKRSKPWGSVQQRVITMMTTESSVYFDIQISSNNLVCTDYGTGASTFYFSTHEVFRDPAAWYHIVVAWDSAKYQNSNHEPKNDRHKMWDNGKLIGPSYSYKEYWDGNHEQCEAWREDTELRIGNRNSSNANPFEGQLADIYGIDGRQLDPSYFGEFDAAGVWQPKSPKTVATTTEATTYSADARWSSTANVADQTEMFNKNIGSNGTYIDTNSNKRTWTPETPIPIKATLEIMCTTLGTRNSDNDLLINGKSYFEDHKAKYGENWNWLTIRDTLTELKSITFGRDNGSNMVQISNIRIDGNYILDSKTDFAYVVRNHNDGTKWSDYLTLSTGSWDGGDDPGSGFDGATNTSAENGTAYAEMVFEPPGGIPYHHIEVHSGVGEFKINDAGSWTATGDQNRWNVWDTSETEKTLTKIQYKGSSGASGWGRWGQIRIDGIPLIDEAISNNFHLDFSSTGNDHAIGIDTSQQVNKLEDSTGGLPIYKTTDDYGLIKGSGTRDDSDSADLILALPLDSAHTTNSIEATIHGSGTNKTVYNGNKQVINSDNYMFYGSSIVWGNTTDSDNDPQVRVNAHADWGIGTGDFTLEAWLYKSNDPHDGNDYLCDQTGNDFGCFWHPSNGVTINGVSNSVKVLESADIPYNKWFHFALVRSSGTFKTYINGTLRYSVAGNWDIGDTSSYFWVGRNNGGFANMWNGRINDFRLYKKAKYTSSFKTPHRNDFQVSNLWIGTETVEDWNSGNVRTIWKTTADGGTKVSPDTHNTDPDSSNLILAIPGTTLSTGTNGTDQSHNINSGSSQKNVWGGVHSMSTSTAQSKFYGTSLYFSGDDYISMQSISDYDFGYNNVCIEMWVRPDDMQADRYIFSTLTGVHNDDGFGAAIWGNGNVRIRADGNWHNTDAPFDGQNLITAGNWHHISCMRANYGGASGHLWIFVDGQLIYRDSGGNHDYDAERMVIGANDGGGDKFKGYMNDIKVYTAAPTNRGVGGFTLAGTSSDLTGQDVLVDSPTDSADEDTCIGGEVSSNYCKLNQLRANESIGLSQGDLRVNGTSGYRSIYGTMGMNGGKWYYEATNSNGGAEVWVGIGLITNDACLNTYAGQNNQDTWGMQSGYAEKRGPTGGGGTYGSTWKVIGDVIGVSVDLSAGGTNNGTITLYKNGSSMGTMFSDLDCTKTYVPLCFTGGASGDRIDMNFGQRPFKHTGPTGHKCICAKNLYTPTITNAKEHFDARLYLGNDASQSIDGVQFQPDLLWIKCRNIAGYDHMAFDAIRGADKAIYLQADHDEDKFDAYHSHTSFDSDGFTIGTASNADDMLNDVNDKFIAYMWEGGTKAANTAGTIDVGSNDQMVNTTAGFSITKYTGNNTSGATVGHGLGAKPDLILIKELENDNTAWRVYHSALGAEKYLILNSNAASTDNVNAWNDTEPTSTVFSLGNAAEVNANNVTYIAYCWTTIKGFSAFGTYTGSGSGGNGGKFLYTGFRPAWMIFKRWDDTADWLIQDAARLTDLGGSSYGNFNKGESRAFEFDSSQGALAETEHANMKLDIVSNGIKHVTDGGANGQANYVYATFAEFPLTSTRAR